MFLTIPITVMWLAFGIFLLVACWSDASSYRLPNWLTGTGALFGLLSSFLQSGSFGLWVSFLGLVVGVVCLYVPFKFKVMGGGDVKFLGAIGTFVGVRGVLVVLLVGSVLGGVLSLVIQFFAQKNSSNPQKKARVPYGIALALAGGYAAYQCGFVGGVL